jgi:hypothetical protein
MYMTIPKALIEIRSEDGEDFERLARESGIDLSSQGKVSGITGAEVVILAAAVVPSLINLMKPVLEHWLRQRRTITIRVGNAIVEADSVDDVSRLLTVLNEHAPA